MLLEGHAEMSDTLRSLFQQSSRFDKATNHPTDPELTISLYESLMSAQKAFESACLETQSFAIIKQKLDRCQEQLDLEWPVVIRSMCEQLKVEISERQISALLLLYGPSAPAHVKRREDITRRWKQMKNPVTKGAGLKQFSTMVGQFYQLWWDKDEVHWLMTTSTGRQAFYHDPYMNDAWKKGCQKAELGFFYLAKQRNSPLQSVVDSLGNYAWRKSSTEALADALPPLRIDEVRVYDELLRAGCRYDNYEYGYSISDAGGRDIFVSQNDVPMIVNMFNAELARQRQDRKKGQKSKQ